jgi:hypothetical protein
MRWYLPAAAGLLRLKLGVLEGLRSVAVITLHDLERRGRGRVLLGGGRGGVLGVEHDGHGHGVPVVADAPPLVVHAVFVVLLLDGRLEPADDGPRS